MGQLSRSQMEKLLRKGESVLYDGAIITSISELPTDAVLAKGDKEKEDAARKELRSQLDEISKQLAQLDDIKQDNSKAAAAREADSKELEAKQAEAKKAEAKKTEEDDHRSEVQSSKPQAKPSEPAKSADKGK